MTTFTNVLEEKFDLVMDIFTTVVTKVDMFGDYKRLTDEERKQVSTMFHDWLKKDGIQFTYEEIQAFNNEYPTSFITPLLKSYGYTRSNSNSKYSKAVEALNALQGEKITILKFSDYGFPIVIHTTLKEASNVKYAQYNESLYIIHKPKRKRNFFSNRIMGSESITVYKGWINIDNKAGYTVERSPDVTVTKSKYGSFDKQFLEDSKQSTNETPVIEI